MDADPAEHNRKMWDAQVRKGNKWTVPVSPEIIAAARQGTWSIQLTSTKPVPKEWMGDIHNRSVLCLASGGGQQGPILAAAGAHVTVLDNSPAQLERDRETAERDKLSLRTVLGDMRDLSMFADNMFDLIVHPCSNSFVPNVLPVWREAFRVLRKNGELLSGFLNPDVLAIENVFEEVHELRVRYQRPYSDLASLDDQTRQQLEADEEPLLFGHSLADLIGGQIAAGFSIIGFFEDDFPDRLISDYMPGLFATRAIRPE